MNLPRPTVAQERWLALAARHPSLRDAVERHGETGAWRQVTPLTRALFFILGSVLALLLASIVVLVGMPWPGMVAGIAQLAAAEYLIRTRRMFACGVDEALFLFGAFAVTFEVLGTVLPGGDGWPWIVAAAALAAGLRMLNAVMAAVAAVAVTIGFYMAFSTGWDPAAALPACVLSFVLACATLAASRRGFQRPAHDAMTGAALIALAACTGSWGSMAREYLAGAGGASHPVQSWLPLLLVTALGAAAATCGLRWRSHAPLWASLVCAGTLLGEALRGVGWPWEWRLIAAGTVVLLFAIAVERGLRRSRRGLTSRPVVADDAMLDLLQLGGTAALAGGGPATRAPDYEGGGGRFGGGGASGNF